MYVGGTFTQELPPTGSGLVVASSGGGTPDPASFPHVVGVVRAAVSDGAGGWYIGGSFTSVGAMRRDGLAHIRSDGTVDPGWDPSPSNFSVVYGDTGPVVDALAVSGSTLYVGGDFTIVGGQTRMGLAALSTATGEATSWNPSPALEFEGTAGPCQGAAGSRFYRLRRWRVRSDRRAGSRWPRGGRSRYRKCHLVESSPRRVRWPGRDLCNRGRCRCRGLNDIRRRRIQLR